MSPRILRYKLLLVQFLLSQCLASRPPPLMHSATMDQNGTFVMRWTPEASYIVIEMEVSLLFVVIFTIAVDFRFST